MDPGPPPKPLRAEARIAAPLDQAWKLVVEQWGEAHRWSRDARSCRLLTPGPVGVGSEREARPRFGPAVRERMVACEPGRTFAYGPADGFGPFAEVRGTWRFAPEEGRLAGPATRVEVQLDLRPRPGAVARLLARELRPMLAWMMRRGLRDLEASLAPRPDVAVEARRDVAQAPEDAWAVVADLQGYARHARSLRSARVVEGDASCPAEGLVRACEDTRGRAWTERLVAWEPPRRYVFEVDTQAPGYPFPFRALRGTFGAEPRPGGGSRIAVRFEARLRRRWQRALLAPAVRRWAQREAEALLDKESEALRGLTAPVRPAFTGASAPARRGHRARGSAR